MLKRSLRRISFPVHLSHILRDTGILLCEMRDGDLKAPMEGDLSKLKMKRIGIESSSEGYTSETQRSASKSRRCLRHSTKSLLVFADYDCRELLPKYGACLVPFS